MMWHFGTVTKCYFCKKPLLDVQILADNFSPDKLYIGSFAALSIKERLTIHHKDGNHHNNDPKNRKPCHRKCHKSWHMRERQALKKI